MLYRFLRQFSHYSVGQLLVLVSSLVSFPLLTRIFTVSDYGIMNLISDTLLILVAFSKGGLQNSIVRFYDEVRVRKQKEELNAFVGSLLVGGLAIAALITAFWIILILALPIPWLEQHNVRGLLLLSSGLIFLRAGESLLMSFLRAEQKTIFLNSYKVAVKYLSLALVLAFVFFVSRSLAGFYWAHLLSMCIALAVLIADRVRRNTVRLDCYSREVFRRSLLFGLPLIGYELISTLLAYADRYMIQYFIGAEGVGLYSAAYNLVDYVKDLVVLPLSSAVMPIYMRTWAKKGKKATREFLQTALRSYLLVAVPLIFGCSAIGENFIHVLASEKFVEGHHIIPWTIAGLMINGALPILAASLYIQEKTKALVGMLTLAALINVSINLFLIPRFGIQGAAMSKLVSYSLLAVAVFQLTHRFIRLRVPWVVLLKYLAAGTLMYMAVDALRVGPPMIELCGDAVFGAAVYFSAVLIMDASLRVKLIRFLREQLQAGKVEAEPPDTTGEDETNP